MDATAVDLTASWWTRSRLRPMRWSFGRWLLVISLGGALLRLGIVVVSTLDNPLQLNDSLYYSMQARRNAAGEWFRELLTDQPGAEHPPLTSLYLTPWSVGSGDAIARQRLAIALLGCVTVPVVGLAARRLWQSTQRPAAPPTERDRAAPRPGPDAVPSERDRAAPWPGSVVAPPGVAVRRRGVVSAERVGLVAAAVAAVYPPLWINDLVVMSETPAMLAVAGALWAAGSFLAAPSALRAGSLGVLVGLAALARSELALYAVGFAMVMVLTAAATERCRAMRRALVLLLAAAVAVSPWVLYNLVRFEHPTLLSTNDGATWLGANCDATYHDDVGHWDVRCLFPLETLRDGSIAADASITSTDRRARAFDYIRDNLGRLPVVVAARVGRLVDVYAVRSMVGNDVREDKPVWAVWAAVVTWWPAAAAAAVGWWQLRRRGAAARWWLLVPPAVALVTAVSFYGAHRMRAPAEPAIVILAAIALTQLLERFAWAADVPSSGTNAAHVDVASARADGPAR